MDEIFLVHMVRQRRLLSATESKDIYSMIWDVGKDSSAWNSASPSDMNNGTCPPEILHRYYGQGS